MLGSINRQTALSKVLNSCPFICELYADTSFSFYTNEPTFVLKVKSDMDNIIRPYMAIQEIYNGKATVYKTHESITDILYNKHLIWYNGRWLI